MKLPAMQYADGIRKGRQVKFGGLNHSVGAKDGEIWDMQNMTSDHSPVLATRSKRYLYRTLTSPGGLFACGGLCWVDEGKFYYQGVEKGAVAAGEKTFASLGTSVVILPDKCYYNTETDTFGSLEARWTGGSLTFSDGILYGEASDANAVSCEGVDWSQYFREGDAVTIRGCTKHTANNKSSIIRAIDGDKLYFYEFSFTLDNEQAYKEEGELAIERTVPDVEFLWENENRLWGCSGTTLYACKQGDVFNWNVYDGLDSDAYAIEPGSAGRFTGCISYRGFFISFKEEQIYKVYGNVPSNFEVMGSASLGLAEGSGKSLAIAGETLFYLSRSGVMAYTGGIPQPVGKAFGTERFANAVAGSDGLKYYVSMQGEDGAWWLYVYDTQRGVWHKEDQSRMLAFAYWDGNLYGLKDNGEIWILGNPQDLPEDVVEEVQIPWFVEFADFVENSPNKKGVGKIQIRMELDKGAQFRVMMQFDSDGVWRVVKELVGEDPKRSWYMPITPRRCDHYRLRLEGTDGCRIHSLSREFYPGSELRLH